MADLKAEAAQLSEKIAERKTAAADAWKAFDDLRTKTADIHDKDAFEKLDAAGKSYDGIKDEIADLELKRDRVSQLANYEGVNTAPFDGQPTAKATGDEEKDAKTFGERFVESKVYKDLKGSGRLAAAEIPVGITDSVKMYTRKELKTLVTGGSATSGGAFIVPTRDTELIDLLRRPRYLRELVTVGETNENSVTYVEQTTRTNNAAETAEASATGDGSGIAPESAVALAVRTTSVRDITHFIPSTKNAIADANELQGILDTEVRDGVLERLDTEIASGDGTGVNLLGITATSGILTRALGADSRSDAVHKAITQIRKKFIEPTHILIDPDDYEQVVLEKDANGLYIYGPPSAGAGVRPIWGLIPVVTTAVANGTPVVIEPRKAAKLWLREDLNVAISDQYADFFTRRMVAILGVLRAAFAVRRKDAVCTITGF